MFCQYSGNDGTIREAPVHSVHCFISRRLQELPCLMLWVYLTTGNGKLRNDPTAAITKKSLMEFYFSYYVKTWDQDPKTNVRKNCNGELSLHNEIHLSSFWNFVFLYKSDYIHLGPKHVTFLNKLLFSNKFSIVFNGVLN